VSGLLLFPLLHIFDLPLLDPVLQIAQNTAQVGDGFPSIMLVRKAFPLNQVVRLVIDDRLIHDLLDFVLWLFVEHLGSYSTHLLVCWLSNVNS